VYPQVVPLGSQLRAGLELLVTLLEVVRGDGRVQVVDVMVFDGAGGVFEPEGDGEVGAALQGCALERPFLLPGAIGWVDRVLHVEDDGPEDLGEVVSEPELVSGDAEGGQDPAPEDDGHYLLEEGPGEHAVSFPDDVEEPEEPDEGHCDEEVYNGLSEDPRKDLLCTLHLRVLLLGEKDGLREIEPVQVPEMFVMVVVAVPPGVVGEMLVDAEQFPDEYVHA
jgi:hypothetical protein